MAYTSDSSISTKEETSDIENGYQEPPQSLPPVVGPPPVDDVTYPEGGRDAWLVVLGACCGLTASIGIYNTAGVFEVIISKTILPETSPSTLDWIFSIYAFVTWFLGVQVGPTFDACGPRALLIAGSICTLVGIFTLSVCTGELTWPLFFHTRC